MEKASGKKQNGRKKERRNGRKRGRRGSEKWPTDRAEKHGRRGRRMDAEQNKTEPKKRFRLSFARFPVGTGLAASCRPRSVLLVSRWSFARSACLTGVSPFLCSAATFCFRVNALAVCFSPLVFGGPSSSLLVDRLSSSQFLPLERVFCPRCALASVACAVSAGVSFLFCRRVRSLSSSSRFAIFPLVSSSSFLPLVLFSSGAPLLLLRGGKT